VVLETPWPIILKLRIGNPFSLYIFIFISYTS